MKFYTHVPAGLLLYTILVWILNQPYTIGGVLFVIFISVLPDMLDRVLGTHRGWGHSAILLIPLVAIAMWIPALSIAGLSAFLMHILLDALTKKGVPFLFPFSKTRLVMPKKEKSRIQTGHKKEIALCLIIIFLLIPASYGVLHGFPDVTSALKGNNSTNKTNHTNLTNSSLLNKDYRSPSSYNSSTLPSNPYSNSANSSSKTSNSSATNSKNSSIDWSSLNNYLNDWWNNIKSENKNNQTDGNNQNSQNNQNNQNGNNNQNNNQNSNNSNPATDVLFGDLRYNNLTEGQMMEENITMNDGDAFFNDMFGDSSNVNPDDNSQYSNQYQEGYYDDSEWDGSGNYFFIMGVLLVAGGFVVKT